IKTRRNWLLSWVVLIGLVVVGLLVGVRISPEAEYAALPARRVWLSWLATAACVTLLIISYWLLPTANSQLPIRFAHAMLPLMLLIELMAASQFQPYSRASDRQALTALRPSTAHLLAGQKLGESGRVLALSGLFFDPGDMPEQKLIYGNQLNEDELYDRVIASKHKEILSPNLSLYYGLHSVDGYDGGLLPTRRFVQFASQFTPTPKTGADTAVLDGRLREFLKAVPENKWLAQMGVRYIIADKTQDVFIEGVYYDLMFSESVTQSLAITLASYESTSLGLVLSATPANIGDLLATARVGFADGSSQDFDIRATEQVTQPYFGQRLAWRTRKLPTSLSLMQTQAQSRLTLRGLTSIDDGDKSFLSQMVRGQYDMRVVHSGDVKIYENLKAARARFGMMAHLHK
ncbi:MAG: hypothetical protein HC853_16625, partial [Anaerolineae bacterium]|nr:hypothetical protein [Anaerolineae bacterium]